MTLSDIVDPAQTLLNQENHHSSYDDLNVKAFAHWHMQNLKHFVSPSVPLRYRLTRTEIWTCGEESIGIGHVF